MLCPLDATATCCTAVLLLGWVSWHQGLLDECLVFMTMHLPSYKANEVAVSLWAVARLKGQPHPCLMGNALQHCFSQVRSTAGHSGLAAACPSTARKLFPGA